MSSIAGAPKSHYAPLPPGRHEKAFTLLELLIVVAIIGALAAIAIPSYFKYVDKAKRALAFGTLDTIRITMEGFHDDHQEYPVKPLNWVNGTDNKGRTVFQATLLQQIKDDIVFVSYNTAIATYTFTARARNAEQTLMTLTPQAITY